MKILKNFILAFLLSIVFVSLKDSMHLFSKNYANNIYGHVLRLLAPNSTSFRSSSNYDYYTALQYYYKENCKEK